MTEIMTKGLIGEQDLRRYAGDETTFTRPSSTGGTVQLNVIGYEVDALISFGAGGIYTSSTISKALAAIGTSQKATLVLRPGTWTISENVDWSAYTNITLKVVPGAVISHGAYTISWVGLLEAGLYPIFSGTGTITIADGSATCVHPEWWDTSTATLTTAAINTAITTASGKAPVWLMEGKTYSVNGRIALASDTVLTGGGTIQAAALGASVTAQGLLYGTEKDRVKIDGITIDCNPTVQNHTMLIAVYMQDSDDFTFINNKVIAEYAGVYCRSTGATTNRTRISGNYFDLSQCTLDSQAAGIDVTGYDFSICENRIVGRQITATTNNTHVGIVAGGESAAAPGKRGIINNNTIKYTYTGIAPQYLEGGTISGNSISDCKTGHHSQGIFPTGCKGITVSSNSIKNIDYVAINFLNTINSAIVGNTIYTDIAVALNDANAAKVIQISATTVTTGENSADNIIVGNNIKYAVSADATDSVNGLTLIGDRLRVIGNSIDIAGWTANGYAVLINDSAEGIFANNYVAANYRMRLTDGDTAVSGWRIHDNTFNIGSTAATVAIVDESTGPNYYYNNNMVTGVQEGYSNESHLRGPLNNRTPIVPKTAAYIVSPYDSGRTFTNTGATGTVIFSLPAATVGLNYKFTRTATQVIQVDPSGTEIIRGGTAGQYAQLDNDAAMIVIECHVAGTWEIVSSVATVSFH